MLPPCLPNDLRCAVIPLNHLASSLNQSSERLTPAASVGPWQFTSQTMFSAKERAAFHSPVFDIHLLPNVKSYFIGKYHFRTGISDIEKEYEMKGRLVYINEPLVGCSIPLTLAAVQASVTLMSSDQNLQSKVEQHALYYEYTNNTETVKFGV